MILRRVYWIAIVSIALQQALALEPPWFKISDAELLRRDRLDEDAVFPAQGFPSKHYAGAFDFTFYSNEVDNDLGGGNLLLQSTSRDTFMLSRPITTPANFKDARYWRLPSGVEVGLSLSGVAGCANNDAFSCNADGNSFCQAKGFEGMADSRLTDEDWSALTTIWSEPGNVLGTDIQAMAVDAIFTRNGSGPFEVRFCDGDCTNAADGAHFASFLVASAATPVANDAARIGMAAEERLFPFTTATFHPLCMRMPVQNFTSEVKLLYTNDPGVNNHLAAPSNTKFAVKNQGPENYFFASPSSASHQSLAQDINVNLALSSSRLAPLKRGVLNMDYICGTNEPPEQNHCQLEVNVLEDELGPDISLISLFADSELHNDGTANEESEWNHMSLALPPMSYDELQRVQIKANLDLEKATLGLDNLMLTTNERCSSRWIRFPGFELAPEADLLKLAPSMDNYEGSDSSINTELNTKYKLVTMTTNSPLQCAETCLSGTSCDMFEHDAIAGECRMTPHLGLKQQSWLDITANSSSDSTSIFVLQCSTAQENVLTHNDWYAHSSALWTLTEATPTTRLLPAPAKPARRGGYTYMLQADVQAGQDLLLDTTLGYSRFPLGIDEAYLTATNAHGIFRTWYSSFDYQTDPEAPRGAGVQHTVSLYLGDATEYALTEEEHGAISEYVSILPNLADQANGGVFTMRLQPSVDASFNFGPMELLIDMPINVGCFDMAALTAPDLTDDSNMTPVECLKHCLGASLRFAAVYNEKFCSCFDDIATLDLQPLQDQQCSAPCTGDKHQFCGGFQNESNIFVATCPASDQIRFGEHCLEELPDAGDFAGNLDKCSAEGLALWWPDQAEEVDFLLQMFPSEPQRHVGYRSFDARYGAIHSDYSRGLGVSLLTHDQAGVPVLSDFDQDLSCVIIDAATQSLSIETSCPVLKPICKSKMVSLNEPLVELSGPEFYSPSLAKVPSDFPVASTLPTQLEFLYRPWLIERYLEVAFPEKVVILSISIETIKDSHLKSFALSSADLDTVQPKSLKTVEQISGQKLIFNVFDSASPQTDVIKRDVGLPSPIYTRCLRLDIEDGSPKILLKLDFYGRRLEKQPRLQRTFNDNYLIKYTIPGEEITGASKSRNLPPEAVCPKGSFYSRWYISSDIDLTTTTQLGTLELSESATSSIKATFAFINSDFALTVENTLSGAAAFTETITGPWQMPTVPFGPFDIRVECSDESLDFYVFDQVVKKRYHAGGIAPTIIEFSWSANPGVADITRLSYTLSRTFGVKEDYLSAHSIQAPTIYNGLAQVSDGVMRNELSPYFLYKAGENYGVELVEAETACYHENPTSSIHCLPTAAHSSQGLIGGHEDAMEVVSCPAGYTYLGTSCSKVESPILEGSFHDAKLACGLEDMIYIPSGKKQSLIFRAAMLKKFEAEDPTHALWIGIEYLNGIWYTVKGQALSPLLADWAPGQPEEDPLKQCAVAEKALGYKWKTEACYLSRSYICTLRSPRCPKSYTWFPDLGRTCLKITEGETEVRDSKRQQSYHTIDNMCNAYGTQLASHPGVWAMQQTLSNWALDLGYIDPEIYLGVRRNTDSGFALLSHQYEAMTQAGFESAYDTLGSVPQCRLIEVSTETIIGEECQSLPDEASSVSRRGLCQYTDCYSDSNPPYACVFPFRYKGRLYDSCITLGADKPWCSTKTDVNWDHIDGNEAICMSDCYVNNCPVGYAKLQPDNTCYKLPSAYLDDVVTSFDEASGRCEAEGARLWQPRHAEAWFHLKDTEQGVLDDRYQYSFADSAIIAVGLKLSFGGSEPVLLYPDDTAVPENIIGTQLAVEWKSGYPENDASKPCVAIHKDKRLINVPCSGYSDISVTTGANYLSYICEARPTEAIKDDEKDTCHLPFIHGGKKHVACAQNKDADTGLITKNQPWCPLVVNESGEADMSTVAICQDERSIAFAKIGNNNEVTGHFCSIPFLMNEKVYESCTREKATLGDKEDYYWCPKQSESNASVSLTSDNKGRCTDVYYPPENGCEDHYEPFTDYCIRVSTYPKTFDDARARCEAEGSDLLFIINQDMQEAIQVFIEAKRSKYKHYLEADNYWIGGRVNSKKVWKWVSTFHAMEEYTNWQLNSPGFGCASGVCTGNEGLFLQAGTQYTWKAINRATELPYVCQSKCRFGYRWFPSVSRCLRVEGNAIGTSTAKSLPKALLSCGKDGGFLAPIRSCAELDLLVTDMRQFNYPNASVYQIGVFYNLHSAWNTRHIETDLLTNSMGYAADDALDHTSGDLCDVAAAAFDNTKVNGYGFAFDDASKETYNIEEQEFGDQYPQHGFICEISDHWGCPEGYILLEEQCFKAYDVKLTHMDAELTCQDYGGTLAKVSTNLHAAFLDELVRDFEGDDLNASDYKYWTAFHAETDEIEDPYQIWSTAAPSLDLKQCVTLSKSGAHHAFELSNCIDKARFICQSTQNLAVVLQEYAVEPDILLPMNAVSGSRDLSGNNYPVFEKNIGYSSLWVPSGMLGAAQFASDFITEESYITLNTGTDPHPDGISILFWIRVDSDVDQETELISLNSDTDSNNFVLKWKDGNLLVALNGAGTFRGLNRYRVTQTGEWHFVAFTFDGLDNTGLFVIDDKYGYNDGTNDVFRDSFSYDDANWLQSSFDSATAKFGADNFRGALSCVQIFMESLSPANIHYYKRCHQAGSTHYHSQPCPNGQHYLDGVCYKIGISKVSFAEAESYCLPKRNEDGLYISREECSVIPVE